MLRGEALPGYPEEMGRWLWALREVRPRTPPNEDYEGTPEWVLFHLVEHESGHAFPISALKSRAGRFFAG
jgi:hypothetical protein